MKQVIKLTKKQKKAIKRAARREAKAQRLHGLLMEYKQAVAISARRQVLEDALQNQQEIENDLAVARAITSEAEGVLAALVKQAPNVRPVEIIHQEIVEGDCHEKQ